MVLMGKSRIKGELSIATLDCRRVNHGTTMGLSKTRRLIPKFTLMQTVELLIDHHGILGYMIF